MFKAYKYLFYRIYSWNLRIWGKSDAPEYNTIVGLTVLVLFNIICIISLLEILLKVIIFKPNEIPIIYYLLIFTIMYGINYFIFIFKKRYEKIVKEFKNEPSKKRNRNTEAGKVGLSSQK